MGENICKWSNRQRINVQNIQRAYGVQYFKKLSNKKWAEHLIRHFAKEDIQMVKRHMKRCSNKSYKEVSPHTGLNGHHQKSTNNKWWRGCGEKWTLLHCWWECILAQTLWRIVWSCLKKLNIELPYNREIPLLGLYSEKTVTEIVHCNFNLHFPNN